MEVVKIGGQQGNTSKNGGDFEFNLIKEELKDIDCNDFMVIVNGYGDESEILASKKKKIFIITDSFAFKGNKNSIEQCDIIMHQSKKDLSFINKNKEQYFSYVPFLFYLEDRAINQSNNIIFGGANTGREDKFQEYLFDEKELLRPNITAFVKKYCLNTGKVLYDDRIDYESFCQIMKYFKYTICFSREEYDKLQWVTPRFIEAISRFVFPFTDNNYAVFGGLQAYQYTASSYDEMMMKIECIDESMRLSELSIMQKIAASYKERFKSLIIDIIS